MNKKRSISLSIFLSLFVLVFLIMPFISSCGKSGTVGPSGLNVQFQIVNLCPNLGSVDLYIKYTKVNSSSYFYPSASGYFFLNAVDTPYQIRPGSTLLPGTVAPSSNIFNIDTPVLKPNSKYTLFITGIVNPNVTAQDSLYEFITRDDTVSASTLGLAKVRFLNASPRSPALNVTANGTAAFTNINYLFISKYIQLPAGTYDFQITAGKSPTIIRDMPNITVQDGRAYTIYSYGLVGHSDSTAFGSAVITNR